MLRVLERARRQQSEKRRKGAVLVLAVFFLAGILTFVGMSVDLGMINVTKSRMQATADSCALAAAQEIVAAIQDAGAEGSTVENVHAYAEDQARAMAKDVAQRNGFLLKDSDVDFGRRAWNAQSGRFEVNWNASPYNAVKVTVRKDGSNLDQADGRLKLMFAPVFGDKSIALKSQASAYVEARDFAAVLDYSGSMNFDSVPFKSGLSKDDVEDNLDDIWDALVDSNAHFSDDSSTLKFPSGGWGKINSYAGTYKYSSSANTIFDFLELGGSDDEGVRFYDYNYYSGFMMELGPGTYNLNNMPGNVDDDINSFRVPDGFSVTLWDFANQGGWQFGPRTSDVSSMGGYSNDAEWVVITGPDSSSYAVYPQEGRYSSGNFKGKPSKSESETLWKQYIQWVINYSNDGYSSKLYIDSNHDYRYDFGYRTLMMYMLYTKRYNNQSEDLWRVPAYPFKAVKDGMTQFNTFLTTLQFGDQLGLVDYATTARKQSSIDDADVSKPNNVVDVDLGTNYLTQDYYKIESIQLHHQASHYSGSTNIGDGIKHAREMLVAKGRTGARWQMIVMTDGAVNEPDNMPSMPAGWRTFDWDNLTDWTGDGVADYNESDIESGNWDGGTADQKRYVFYQAKLAKEQGIAIHAMAVGNGADTKMMKALATMGNGVYIHIPGGTSPEVMSATLEAKFNLLAGNVPPAKLLYE